MEKKTFLLYTHHFSSVTLERAWQRPGPLGTAVRVLGRGIFAINYLVGAALYYGSQALARLAERDFRRTLTLLPERLRAFQVRRAAGGLAVMLLSMLMAPLLVSSFRLVAQGLDLKGRVLGLATLGQDRFRSAAEALGQQDTVGAQAHLARAIQDFKAGQQELEGGRTLIGDIVRVLPQGSDAQELLKSGQLLAEGGAETLEFYRILKDFRLTTTGVTAKSGNSVDLVRLSGQLERAADKVNEANRRVQAIAPAFLGQREQAQLSELKTKLARVAETLGHTADLFSLMADLAGGQKNVLVLFENSNELRPSGGFIGTYGSFQLKNGGIHRLTVSSIYDLDGQLGEQIAPPSPVLAVNPRWYLRDSNWFADFRQSARKASSFYEKEGGETPDLVIAVTPDLVVDLLGLTGPVTVGAPGITFGADNFIEVAQIHTSSSAGDPLNAPKQILGDFFVVLTQRLSELKPEQYPRLLEVLEQNLSEKNLLLYARDQGTEGRISRYGWDGSIAPSDRDYLAVVSANLGGTKTDRYISDQVTLKSSVAPDGTVTDELTVRRSNRLPDLPETQNKSFLRVLVPEGATLLANSGFDYVTIDPAGSAALKQDADVYAWEKGSVRDVLTGTTIGREAGKTFFGNWLTVKGGETKTVTLTYRLPFKLSRTDRLSLLVQKQAGAPEHRLRYELSFPSRRLEWQNVPSAQVETSSLVGELTVNRDRFFGSVLSGGR